MNNFFVLNFKEYLYKKPRCNFLQITKYVIYKHVFDIFKIFSFQSELPWLNFAAIDFVNKYIENKVNLQIFEYGSGGSTLFFLKKGFNVATVEHCKTWYENVKNRIKQNECWENKWSVFFIEPEYDGIKQNSEDILNPLMYKSADFTEYNFKKYVSSVDNYPDAYFDIILIDGRARPSCIMHAVAKVKPEGIVIIDNSERAYYFSEKTKTMLKGFSLIFDAFSPITGVKTYTRTSIFQKTLK